LPEDAEYRNRQQQSGYRQHQDGPEVAAEEFELRRRSAFEQQRREQHQEDEIVTELDVDLDTEHRNRQPGEK